MKLRWRLVGLRGNRDRYFAHRERALRAAEHEARATESAQCLEDRATGLRDWINHATAAFRLGDIVTVGRASGVNGAGAVALVVEVYELAGRLGWTLLFADGRSDGFSPADCELFEVRRVGHARDCETYHFRSRIQLDQDWQAGRFASAFPKRP